MQSPVAQAIHASRTGDLPRAQQIVATLVQECFSLTPISVHINQDQYSLNSLNGLLTLQDGEEKFFKFHHEEGEEAAVDELYQASILREAGLPVDVPSHVSHEVGRQILLYPRRRDQRFADLCRALDTGGDIAHLVEAQRKLDAQVSAVYQSSLHQITAAQSAAEPIHQLFYKRLTDPDSPAQIGGRGHSFFHGRGFILGDITLGADDVREASWIINGVAYQDNFGRLLARSKQLLKPEHFTSGVIAHGDAHNANIWHTPGGLVMFDPAFAGHHVPALLAEVKASMHNIFAHPFWLYDADEVPARYIVNAKYKNKTIELQTNWHLSPLREAFLESKIELVWRPLLATLAERGWLPADWRAIIRSALFCCPALVMELRAGTLHNPVSSAIGLAVAVMLGSEPEAGETIVTRFLSAVAPA